MRIRLTADEQGELLRSALKEDTGLFPGRVAALLSGAKVLTLEEAAALYLYLEDRY